MIETERLILRQWRDSDREPFAAMVRDPEVMACFPALLDREQSDKLVDRVSAMIERDGFGYWALEVKGGAPFIGYTGIYHVPFEAPFTPAVELGWRLARASWGHGYASEAARAAIAFGFGTLGLTELVSFLIEANTRSAAVCERLGMRRDPSGDFDHPRFTADQKSVAGFPQRRHVLYRLGR